LFLSGNFLGISFLQQVYSIPENVAYDKIEIFGDCKIDKVRGLSLALTDEEVDALRYIDTYTWSINTFILAEFNNTLVAGNIEGIVNPITTWEIYRKESTDTRYELLDSVDVLTESHIDYTARAYRNYDYRLFAKNDTEISTPIDAETIFTDWYHWSLTDVESGTVYLFDLDLVSDSISRSQDVTNYDSSFAKYTQTTYGQQDSISGGISATGGTIDCNEADFLNYQREYLTQLGDLINNKKTKILKSRFGDAWVVRTDNFQFKYMDVIQRQLATISFTFRQVDDL